MENFVIMCNKCGSVECELDIGMGQGLGYVTITCTKCGAEESEEQPH